MITDIKDITSFKWATVVGNNPLTIRLDGDSSPLALIPDSLVDPLSLAAGDRVRAELSLRKVVIHGVSNGGAAAGEGRVWFASVPPVGWLLCNGQSLLRSEYSRLYTAIGVTYGAVDSTHFNIPDVRGKALVGVDSSQAEFNLLGKVGGSKTVTLTEAQMPSHVHALDAAIFRNGLSNGSYTGGPNLFGVAPFNSGAAGGNQPHPNLQPYLAANYIIKI